MHSAHHTLPEALFLVGSQAVTKHCAFALLFADKEILKKNWSENVTGGTLFAFSISEARYCSLSRSDNGVDVRNAVCAARK